MSPLHATAGNAQQGENAPIPKVSVIIPTVLREDLLRDCLESLRQQAFHDFETILISNGAGNWANKLAAEFGCTLVAFPENRGFAAAVNAGIALSRSPYVALLNDDVRLENTWLELTFALLKTRADVSFCCGKIYQSDGVLLDNAGDALSLGGSAWRLGFGRQDSASFAAPRQVFAAPATAALFRRCLFDQIGGLDEDFFSYLEDIDFSLRAGRSGSRGFYLPQATCRHQGSASLGESNPTAVFRLLTQNQLMILAKHYPWRLLLRMGPRIAWSQMLWAVMAIRKNRIGAYLSGVAHFFWRFRKTIRKRTRWRLDELQNFVALLRESEREIYEDTTAADRDGQDTFWRLYFFLFPPSPGHKSSVNPDLGHLPG